MYSEIFAVKEYDSSRGKTTRAWSDVKNLVFAIDPSNKLLEIKASCYEDFGTGERGGEPTTINREFLLQLEKIEVEKLVATALNKKLLKKLDIANLHEIDPVGKLELDNSRVKAELDLARKEIRRLKKIIDDAKLVLGKSVIQ